MKYSFLVDESTTVGLINAAMAEKLQIDHEKYQCKLVNCVPGGQGKYTVHQPKLKLKLLLQLLDYNNYYYNYLTIIYLLLLQLLDYNIIYFRA